MTEEIKEPSTPQSDQRLVSAGFEEMQYWITVSRDKFDVEKFREELGPRAKREDSFTTTVAPRDPASGAYHLLVNWSIGEKEVRFLVQFIKGSKDHEKDEHEPYAEQFMEWLGRFFKNETAHSHVHARFTYLLEARQSKFPLPLKTALEGDAEIDGISLRLPGNPNGVSRIRLSQGKSRWFVEVIANGRITFEGFTPYSDVQRFLAVMGTLLEEKR